MLRRFFSLLTSSAPSELCICDYFILRSGLWLILWYFLCLFLPFFSLSSQRHRQTKYDKQIHRIVLCLPLLSLVLTHFFNSGFPGPAQNSFPLLLLLLEEKKRQLWGLSFTQKKMWFSFSKVSEQQCAAQHPSVLNVLLYFSKLAVTSGTFTASWILFDTNLLKLLRKWIFKISLVMDFKKIHLILR